MHSIDGSVQAPLGHVPVSGLACPSKKQMLWHLRQKFHYSDHLLQFTSSTQLNPQAISNFIDEDHMKFLSRADASISISTLGCLYIYIYICIYV